MDLMIPITFPAGSANKQASRPRRSSGHPSGPRKRGEATGFSEEMRDRVSSSEPCGLDARGAEQVARKNPMRRETGGWDFLSHARIAPAVWMQVAECLRWNLPQFLHAAAKDRTPLRWGVFQMLSAERLGGIGHDNGQSIRDPSTFMVFAG